MVASAFPNIPNLDLYFCTDERHPSGYDMVSRSSRSNSFPLQLATSCPCHWLTATYWWLTEYRGITDDLRMNIRRLTDEYQLTNRRIIGDLDEIQATYRYRWISGDLHSQINRQPSDEHQVTLDTLATWCYSRLVVHGFLKIEQVLVESIVGFTFSTACNQMALRTEKKIYCMG